LLIDRNTNMIIKNEPKIKLNPLLKTYPNKKATIAPNKKMNTQILWKAEFFFTAKFVLSLTT
ncbi:hypothetical protein P9X77_27305, partial [Bacillus cereus]|nr:hypothetical protein [Bacillus cereus]